MKRLLATVALAAGVAAFTAGCWPYTESKTPVSAPTGGPTPASSTVASPTNQPPNSAGLSGTWTGTWGNQTPDQSTGTFTLTWSQNGNNLAGTITITGTPCLSGGSITGSVSGSTITFGAVQGEVEVKYSGSIAGQSMSGTYQTDCGNAKGTWNAVKK
jgi:hypothetical protein